jgi:serine/threonine-protein kinase 24/25/MST4
LDDIFDKQELIGKGSFGEVFRGRDKKSGEEVAIKVVDLDDAEDEIESIQSEISILSQCACPYIVKYYGSYIKGTKLWIIMEFMGGGSAKDFLDDTGPIDEVFNMHMVKRIYTIIKFPFCFTSRHPLINFCCLAALYCYYPS